jgi:hypothetical protein
MLETATKYVLDLLTDNEELKKFPKEFVNESVKWVKSWFLTPEDPKNKAKLEDPNKSIEVKKDIIQDKLDDLKENPQFVKELTERMAAFEQQKITKLNVIEGGSFKVQKDVHIGTVGTSNHKQADEENVIKNAQFDVGGDFRLGNTTHIVNHFGNDESKLEEKFFTRKEAHDFFNDFELAAKEVGEEMTKLLDGSSGNVPQKNTPPQYSSLKTQLQQLIKKEEIEAALDLFMDEAEKQGLDCFDELLLLSARFNRAKRSERKGTDNPQTERNRINDALVSLIKDLE